uniref:tetratricopeptide repeat protein n=1 Tax=Altererythrobacter segetis TaxID=1104773 RepID=UPI001FAFF51C|nr:tetratricopeptide repeat protein [Altererythrobacter segetis]
MALTPTSDPNADKLAVRRAAEQDVLLREVDEAVRQDEAAEFAKRYGKSIIALVVLALAAFGAWLWWKDYREGQLEKGSEQFVQALDQLEAGRTKLADAALDPIAQDGTAAAAAGAKLIQAGEAIAKGDNARATTMLFTLADDKDAPQAYRDLASIRGVAASFDTMKPDDVIARLKPLAKPGNPWFGSAGELVAMAYLKQGKKDLAGPLFAAIAKEEDAPKSIRSRARQMAGVLGYDAVVDVDQVLAEERINKSGPGASAQ